jgi:L-methionine (R)-S-oxide reductase
MIEKEPAEDMLILGPFKGSMTPHTRIRLNQGICGAAASSGETVIVDDVGTDSRYLACSAETKSEIVVPVFVAGTVVGELDIDSHFRAAFASEDKKLCEYAAKLLGTWIESHPHG